MLMQMQMMSFQLLAMDDDIDDEIKLLMIYRYASQRSRCCCPLSLLMM
jgi:hypothetical protein